jgi:serine/threonine-protein kinase RsbW
MHTRQTRVRTDAAQLPALTQFLHQFWAAAALLPTEALPFELALEEAFMNVVMHGAPGGGEVEVGLALDARGVTMTFSDGGPAFDPLTLPAPDVTLPLAQRRIGGNGVFLIRQMMDTVSYRRSGDRNELTLTKQVSR